MLQLLPAQWTHLFRFVQWIVLLLLDQFTDLFLLVQWINFLLSLFVLGSRGYVLLAGLVVSLFICFGGSVLLAGLVVTVFRCLLPVLLAGVYVCVFLFLRRRRPLSLLSCRLV